MSDAPGDACYVAQIVCPLRHSIVAVAILAPSIQEAFRHVKSLCAGPELDEYLRNEGIDPWCSLCHAPRDAWNVRVSETVYESLDAAQPALRACQREQAAAQERARLARQN